MIAVALNAPITEGPILRLPARRDTFLPKRDDIEAYGEDVFREKITPPGLKNTFMTAIAPSRKRSNGIHGSRKKAKYPNTIQGINLDKYGAFN